MMTRLVWISFLVSFALTSRAQNSLAMMAGDNIASGHVHLNFARQDGDGTEGPYHIDFKNELPYGIASAALLTSGAFLIELNKKAPFTPAEIALLDSGDINRFDRGATNNSSALARSWSDAFYRSSIFLPYAVALSSKKMRSNFGNLFVLSAEALLISGAINMNAKHLVNRTRPYVYNSDFPIETRTNGSSRLSFFSGHTSITATSTFFIAKVLHDHYPDMSKGLKFSLWSGALIVPAFTGYLRVKSGRHYNSDVLAGLVIGAAIGYLVPWSHLKNQKISLLPELSLRSSGLSLLLCLG